MPLISITMGEGRTPEQKRELMAAVTKAAEETTGTPLRAIRVWINEVKSDELMIAGETLAERKSGGQSH